MTSVPTPGTEDDAVNPYCHYHPADAARWHCVECQRFYCAACMPDTDKRRGRGLCPHCNHPLHYRGNGGQTPPFWERTGKIFSYPLATDSMAVIILCTLVPLLIRHSLVGLAITLLMLAALVKYDYAVLRRTADGGMKPPPFAEAFSRQALGMAFQQLGLFVAMGLMVYLAARLGGGGLAVVTLIFLTAALPAAIMTLALEQNIVAAINPLHLSILMGRIGWPYVVLYAYLILLILTGATIQQFMLDHFPAYVGRGLSGAVNSYFTLVLFHLLGYALYQYRDRLGMDAGEESPDSTGEPWIEPHPEKRRDADLDMALKDGRYDRAQTLIMESLRQDPDNRLRLQQLYRLLSARNDKTELQRQRDRLLPWLLEQADPEMLIGYLKRVAVEKGALELENPDLALRCAQRLHAVGEHGWVLRLLRDFHKRFPQYPALAEAYLLAAQSLANGFQQWDRAAAFLRFIAKRCPDHPLSGQMDAYLARVRARQPLGSTAGVHPPL